MVLFKKRKIRCKTRKEANNDNSEDETTVVVKKEKKQDRNPIIQSTNVKKQQDDITVFYKSSRNALRAGPSDQGATAILQTETEKDNGNANGNTFSGMVRKPIRAPSNLRTTVRWDYQPDICKDYKETGLCGFGDSCKFLHDRSDYKSGWQLEIGAAGENDNSGDVDDKKYEIDSGKNFLICKCFICKNNLPDPVITRCKHYFCEKCALGQYRKSTRCYVCNTQTNGTFNPAKKIIARTKMEEKEKIITANEVSNED